MFPISAGNTQDGEAITIRIFEAAHTDDLHRLIERNRARLEEWLPWVAWSNSPVDTATHIHGAYERYLQSNGFSAGIWVKDRLAGAIGLHDVNAPHRSSSIGYWLAEDYVGKGVMTSACRALITAVFAAYRLHRVEIRCATGNHRSRGIAKRLGFTYEGLLREAEWLHDHFVDLEVYSVLEQEWPGIW